MLQIIPRFLAVFPVKLTFLLSPSGIYERPPRKEGPKMTETKRPDYAAFVVRDREDKKANWREIGVAFNHKDGKGLDILLDATPVSGRLVLREIEDKTD
jgi:hypothetical protein